MLDRDVRFQAIYDAHSRLVYNFLYRFLREEGAAEDAVIETFRRAYKALDAYRGECSERAWLMKIASNVAKRAKTSGAKHVHSSLESMEDGKGGCEPSSPVSTERLVLDAIEAQQMLDMLGPLQRQAVWMRVGLQMTDADVAEALDVPVGTVKSWVWRSLAKLRKTCQAET